MATPTDLVASSDEIDVTNRSQFSGALADESFDLGPYRVTDVSRKWNTSTQTEIPGYSGASSNGGFSYQFHGTARDFAGSCSIDSNEDDYHLEGGATLSFQFAGLGCTCNSSHGNASLLIDDTESEEKAWLRTSQGGRFELSSIYDIEGGGVSNTPTGYRADSPSASLGAVDVTRPGRVWLARDASDAEREEAACLFAGLMLYDPETQN